MSLTRNKAKLHAFSLKMEIAFPLSTSLNILRVELKLAFCLLYIYEIKIYFCEWKLNPQQRNSQ